MRIDRGDLIYFSPTGTTRQVLTAVAQSIAPAIIRHVDLTLPGAHRPESSPDDDPRSPKRHIVALGAPVYAGRLPSIAVERLHALRGEGEPAVLVVVYGNRAYEDALLELSDLASDLGFRPIAGAAFIGEHSYSSPSTPIAAGRPDDEDLDRARAFGARIRAKLDAVSDPSDLPPLEVPGNRPYRTGLQPSDRAATTRPDLCTLCGRCTEVCPVAAITIDTTVRTNALACILCNACIRACPTGARAMDDPDIARIAQWLNTSYADRKQPETFL